MRERPILFSAPMVRALLDGTKTQTRRVVKLPRGYRWLDLPAGTMVNTGGHKMHRSDLSVPYGQPSDRLWVRETWMPDAPRNGEWADMAFYRSGMSPLSEIPECYRKPRHCLHRATWQGCELVGWKPSIHMPRWASRIDLEITGVRVERLQDISDEDAVAEGTPCYVCDRTMDGRSEDDCHCFHSKAKASDYRSLWEQINGAGSWAVNPWVWVVEFRRIRP